MIKTLLIVGVLLVPSVALAQDEAGGGGSGAGGSNSMEDGPYIPANDPNCPAALSWDWFVYCSRTDPQYGRTLEQMTYHNHSCDGDLKMALLVCAVGTAGSNAWCNAAGAVCAAGGAWGYIEEAWNRLLGDVNARYNYQFEFGDSMPYGNIPLAWLMYW